jgi:hypothetical protein
VTERQLPQISSFALRVDSSLGTSLQLPAEAADALSAQALQAAQEGKSTAEVCLSLLPHLQELAASHSGPQVPPSSLPFSALYKPDLRHIEETTRDIVHPGQGPRSDPENCMCSPETSCVSSLKWFHYGLMSVLPCRMWRWCTEVWSTGR